MSYETLVATATARPDGPSEKQIKFVLRLAGERRFDRIGSDGVERMDWVAAVIENGATKRQVSAMISDLVKMPIDDREVASSVPAPREAVDTTVKLTPGVFQVDGQVYVVKFNQAKTHLYAKRLVEIKSDRLNVDGDYVQVEFEYAPGAIGKIKPEHRMGFESAKALTLRYGRCINCGRKLKAAKSVEQGIGPVCRKAFN
jgi:hypothetical protein